MCCANRQCIDTELQHHISANTIIQYEMNVLFFFFVSFKNKTEKCIYIRKQGTERNLVLDKYIIIKYADQSNFCVYILFGGLPVVGWFHGSYQIFHINFDQFEWASVFVDVL